MTDRRLLLRTTPNIVSVDPDDPRRGGRVVYEPVHEWIVNGSLCASKTASAVVVLDEELLVRITPAGSERWDLSHCESSEPVGEPRFLNIFGLDPSQVLLWEALAAPARSIPTAVSLESLTTNKLGCKTGYVDAFYVQAGNSVLLVRAEGTRHFLEETDCRSRYEEWPLSLSTYSVSIDGVLGDGTVVLSDINRLYGLDRQTGRLDVLADSAHHASVSSKGDCMVFMRGEGELWEWTRARGERLVSSRSELPRLYRDKSYARSPVMSPDARWVLWWWEGPPRAPHTELVDRTTGATRELPFAHDACWVGFEPTLGDAMA